LERGEGFSTKLFRPLKSAMESRNLKAISTLNGQMLKSISDDDEIWGQWEWDSELEEFEFIKELNNKLIMKFPSSDKSKTNDAIFTLEYAESDVEMPDGEGYYPSDLNCELKIDGEVVMLFSFSADYNSDGTPKRSSSTLELGDYKWSETFKNDNKKLTIEYQFTYKKENLIKLNSTINGDLTMDQFEDAETPDELFEDGFINFQLMDLGIFGGIKDMAALTEDMEDLEDSEFDYDSEEYSDETAKILNDNLIMYAYFADDNKKFADVEFYTYETTETYWDWELVNGNWVEYEYTTEEYELRPRLVLSDGSKVDLEEYFEAGFDDLIERMEDATEDFEYYEY
jgi:hypothetical protein